MSSRAHSLRVGTAVAGMAAGSGGRLALATTRTQPDAPLVPAEEVLLEPEPPAAPRVATGAAANALAPLLVK